MGLFRRKPRPAAAPPSTPDAAESRDDVFAGGLEAVRPLLIPRLRRADQLPDRQDCVVRELGGDFLAVLGARTPSGLYFLRTGQMHRWGADPAELWSVGLHNLRREPPEVTVFQPDAGPVYQVKGGAWTATQLLRAEELVEVATPHGCVVAMPGENLLVLHPLVEVNSYLRIMELQKMLPRLCGPQGGFSDGLFHWHRGVLTPLRVVEQHDPDGKLVHSIQGGAELAAILRAFGNVPGPPPGRGDSA
ncbi:hypothetical protein [Streptomyces noursei]|uniref:hypothetical protein n=1 Tax=Streptomyces noursei TaxID=1971 RepID=UPI0023B811EE|nr:hypothetical protein [Streptomyces noursei]